jgi:putative endonuclease
VRRVAQHNAKLVPGFTREYGVDKLVHVLEARWRRAWKIALIEKSNPDWRDLFEHYAV